LPRGDDLIRQELPMNGPQSNLMIRTRRRKPELTLAKQRQHRRLALESLESRRLLATFTVTNLDDAGAGSLRQAVIDANSMPGADTVDLSAVSGTIALTSGELDITEALTIDGPGQHVLTIDAQQQSRIFNVPTGDLTIAGLTLTGGRTTEDFYLGAGAAIRSNTYGNLTIDRSTISGNSTAGGGLGGGIFSRGDVTVNRSTVSGNSTAGGGGGGIYSVGGVTLMQSTVSGNSTEGSGANGGGIFSFFGDVTLTQSTVSGNSTEGGGGGGVRAYGAVTLIKSTITDNSTAGSGANGGGVSAGDVTLTNSTVSGNSTTGDDADGGGIHASGDVTLMQSTISGNSTAGGSGGGIISFGDVTLTQSTVTDNHAIFANATGGGIWAYYSPIAITGSIVAGNTAGGGMPDIDPGTGTLNVDFSLIKQVGLPLIGSGNLVGVSADLGPLANNGGLTLTHALLATSLAIDAGDPGIVFNPAELDQRGNPFVRVVDGGGGLRIDMGATERQTVVGLNLVVDTPIDENDADYSVGDLSLREAIGLANGSVGADTITFDSIVFNSPETIALLLGEMRMTEAVNIDGPGQDLLTLDASASDATPGIADGMGSRIFNIDDGDDGNLFNVTISGLALTGGDVVDNGGAIRSRENLSVTSSTITGNAAVGSGAQGGGIYSTLGDLCVQGSTISGNSVEGGGSEGGGILTFLGDLMVTTSTITGNAAVGNSADGGGIFFAFGDVTVESSTISGNSAADLGGGIFGLLGDMPITNSTISDNSAGGSGGGISLFDVFGAVTTTIAHSTIAGNMADTDATGTSPGGGIFIDGAMVSVTLDQSIVADNSDFSSGAPDISGTVNAEFSLIENTNGTTILGSDNITGSEPMLGPLNDNGGPTFTHAVLPGSPALDAGDPNFETPPDFDQRGDPFVRVFGDRIDIGSFESQPFVVDGDFNDDGVYDCLDIDALVAEIAMETNGLAFDMTGDGLVDLADRDAWLTEAGAINLGPGKVYLLGDANLDGFVDGLDFIEWNTNKFTSVAAWCAGDFNADGVVDGLDFIIWNANKFQSSDRATQIVLPRPSSGIREINDTRHIQANKDTIVGASSVSPWVAPLVPKPVDWVFAMSRRGEDHKDERTKADSFENLGDDLPTLTPLIDS
jgi:hypothetical protein